VHHREYGHLIAETFLVEQGAVALDVAGLLQRAHPPQAGRSRDADAAGKLDIGDSAILLQLLEDLPVNGVETGGHGKAPEAGLCWPNC
jgi:hypothetical protein